MYVDALKRVGEIKPKMSTVFLSGQWDCEFIG